jgi:DNA repair protein RecN (Recombination protein N)
MLTELRIKNFAIIESLSLPLARGFNVLSGETGAGKSIIVGALGLLLGERASADLIRSGADRATVEGVFDITERPDVAELLDQRGIDADDLLVVLKREVAAAGRARAWINGTPVSAGLLAEVGRHLVNLHGQHEAQALLDGDSQRQILDAFAGSTALAEQLAEAHSAWGAVRREIAELERRRADAERRADYLRHVVKEIDDARLSDPDEDGRLEDEGRRLEHAEELRSIAGGIVEALEGDEEGVLHTLAGIERQLAALQRIDSTLQRLQELYDSAFYNLEALARELDDYTRVVELDPERLDEVRRRRDLIFRMTRKYGPTLGDVIETGRRTRSELDLVDSTGIDLRQLQAREREARARVETLAHELRNRRAEAAGRLGAAVDENLPALGMPDGRFTVRLVALPEITSAGAEAVEFCVALNIGHEARLLARVASGGELSRVTLALKTILARLDRVPTLVFDEVDAGIGGRVGLQVGETLRSVAAYHQVFAITHLPQIAARAHHHIVVSKGARGGVTAADVTIVAGEDRVAEVARMLGGDPESDTSRAHARELLETAAAREGALATTAPANTGATRRSRRR